MRFEDKELKTTFEIPDRLTPRQALRYAGVVDFDPEKSMYERLWPGACVLIENWQSEYVPEAKPEALDLDGDYPQEYLDVIKWASLAVFSFVRRRQQVEKN